MSGGPDPKAKEAARPARRSRNPLRKSYGYHIARLHGRALRRLHGGLLSERLTTVGPVPADLDVDYLGFSGERDILEQLASLRSFLRYVGRPRRVVLGSDGTHSTESLRQLRRLHDQIEVIPPDTYVEAHLPDRLRAYAAAHPLGKKIAYLMWVRPERTVFYADADVLFFPGADVLRPLLAVSDGPPRYLLDCGLALDPRVCPPDLQEAPPVNSGVWILHERLAWEEPLALLEALTEPFVFHTEQTLFHVAMHRAGGVPLDPARFVMKVDDRFRYRTRYEHDPIALRHYVSNIRHQFWLNL